MWWPGVRSVQPATAPRWPGSPAPRWRRWRSPQPGLATCMWTLWGHSHRHMRAIQYTHLLTMIDRSTRWPEAVLLRETTAEAVLDAFVAIWVARHGVPANLTSDRGVQFTSATWTDWCSVQRVWGGAHPNYSFPPPGQWDGGEDAPADEGHPTCQGRRRRLGGSSTVGHAGHPSFPQGGVWHISRGGCSGARAGGPRSVADHHSTVSGHTSAASGHPRGQADLRWGRCHPCPGWSYPRLRTARRCGAAAGGQLRGPLPGAGEGAKGVQVAAGNAAGGGEPGPAEALRGDGTTSGGGSATQGAATWEERLDLSSRLQKICGE